MSYLGPISSHKHKVDFGKIIVLSHLYIAKGKVTKISYSLDNIKYFETKAYFGENINLHNLVCRYLSFDADIEFTYDLGTGYIGYPADEWTNKFVKDYGWTGGDGLFSFNLTGADNRFAKESDKSLLIFGDTFVGTLSKDHVRLAPLAMPNNSYCELDSIDCNKSNFDFHVNEDEKGRIKAYLEPTNELMQEGTQAYHLVNYASKSLENNYLSSYAPKKDISITFKFSKTYVDFIEIENYFVESEKDYGYQKRGVKNITILVNGQNIKTELQSSSYTTIGSTIIPIKKETDDLINDLKESQRTGKKFNDEKYINKFKAKKHDHFLIPAGTIHCSGKNTMVLEISATPYIFTFKLWDWGRLGLDGLPRPVHIEHGEHVIQFDRDTTWVKNNLINRFVEMEDGSTKTGLHEREFIETRRYFFDSKITIKTCDSVNMNNLVEGQAAVIESTNGEFDPFVVHYAETYIIPESIKEYTIRPLNEGEKCGVLKAYVR